MHHHMMIGLSKQVPVLPSTVRNTYRRESPLNRFTSMIVDTYMRMVYPPSTENLHRPKAARETFLPKQMV